MSRKSTFKTVATMATCISLLASCGDNPYIRAATGAVIGGGIAFAVDGDPLIGAIAGGGIGYLTDRGQVDFGESPIE